MRITGMIRIALSFGLLSCVVWGVNAQTVPSIIPLMSRETEKEMALRAAPVYLREGAGIYVLGREGFKKVRESTNGFNCLVGRQGVGVKAPVCYDAEGSVTTLVASLRSMQLLQQGRSESEVERLIDDDYRTGKLLAPRRSGIAYMLSAEFIKEDPKTKAIRVLYPPHVMIYAPYLKNADIGVRPDQVRSKTFIWVLNEGRPDAYIIVPATEVPVTEQEAH
jgi:hypothetical protein